MNKRGREQLLKDLLKRIGEVLVKSVEPEEPKTPKDEFAGMIVPQSSTEPIRYKVREYSKNKDILLSLEALQKDREQISKQKEGLAQEKAQIEDQHKSLQRATIELNGIRK